MRALNNILATALMATAAAHAQQPRDTAHPITLGLQYTYLHANILPGCNCFGLNGGGGDLGVQLNPHWSALADITASHRGGITPDNYQLTQFTYTFGMRYRPLPRRRIIPFGELLLGGAHVSGSLAPNNSGIGGPPNAFALQTGGGITLRLAPRLQITPARIDYLLTTFQNNSANRQNDLRLSAGVAVLLGKGRR
jgi:hypothetical protein